MSTPASEAESRLQRIESMTDATRGRTHINDPIADVLDELRVLLHVDTAVLLELDVGAGQLVPVTARGVEEEVHQGVRLPLGEGFAGRIVVEDKPLILQRVDRTTVVNPILWRKGIHSLLGVPIRTGGKVTGVLHVGTLAARSFTDQDVDLLQQVADRVAVATHVRRLEVHRVAALVLQHSLLPARLPQVPGLELAARYVTQAPGVGGDWYDLFTLPSGWLGIVVGDVAGHGLAAAVVMGRMRSALRAYALGTEDPAVVLQKLDRLMQYFEPDVTATVLYALVEPSCERMHISSAGHPPPAYAVPGAETRVLGIPADPLVGASPDLRRRNSVVDLAAGALVLFYTDGLIERRGTSLDWGFERLCESVVAGPVEAVCTAVMGDLVGTDVPDDDIAVVAVRRV